MFGVLVAILRLDDVTVQSSLACESHIALIVPVGIRLHVDPIVARMGSHREKVMQEMEDKVMCNHSFSETPSACQPSQYSTWYIMAFAHFNCSDLGIASTKTNTSSSSLTRIGKLQHFSRWPILGGNCGISCSAHA